MREFEIEESGQEQRVSLLLVNVHRSLVHSLRFEVTAMVRVVCSMFKWVKMSA